MSQSISPFAPRPFYLAAKPAGPQCNLACAYCYYSDKAALYDVENSGPAEAHGDGHKASQHAATHMSAEVLETFIRQYIESQATPYVLFTWHGGEALLRPLSFYERAMELQQRYAGGRHIDNCLQTNGTLLTAEWSRFLARNEWLVGLSIDGPEPLHDYYRVSKGGQPSWRQAMRGVELLERHGVMWNALAVVTDRTAQAPEEFYRFFRSMGCRYLQFTPVVERLTADGRIAPVDRVDGCRPAPFSVGAAAWGDFLCRVFDEWLRGDVGEMFVQTFDATLANWVGAEPGICSLSRGCGHAAVVEHNGDVYSCDHFVFPQYRLGNLTRTHVSALMNSPQQNEFASRKTQGLPGECRRCQWLFLCNGECPRNRFDTTANGEPGLNHLCAGYKRFFDHSADAMARMKELVEAGREAREIMFD